MTHNITEQHPKLHLDYMCDSVLVHAVIPLLGVLFLRCSQILHL